MKNFIYCIIISIIFISCEQPNAPVQNKAANTEAILALLHKQEAAWNNADMEGFMEGYWKSDSLQFIGSEGINRGWQTTLDNYKRKYPDKNATGTLKFDILQHEFVSPDACFLTGRYNLTRADGDLHGLFTLILRKKNGEWVVVYDHSS